MAKIKNGFNKLKDADLSLLANIIVAACTNNPGLLAIQANVLEAGEVATTYTESLPIAQGGDKLAIAIKNENKAALVKTLRSLGELITGVAKGDEPILISSAFPLAKVRSNKPPIRKPPVPKAVGGVSPGEVLVTGVSEKSAVAVVFLVCDDPTAENPVWVSHFSTTRKIVIKNLESGKRYWFKQAFIGVRKQYVVSDATSYVVQ